MPVRPSLAAALACVAVAACGRREDAARGAPTAEGASPAASASAAAATPATPAPSAPAPQAIAPRITDVFATTARDLRVVPVHHATVLFEFAGETIYVDPTTEADLTGLPRATFVFFTHAHPDHFDPKVLDRLRSMPMTFVVAPEAIARQIPGAQWLTAGERRQFNGFWAEAMPAYNLKRGPSPGKLWHRKGEGLGYLFDFRGRHVYVAGDTECTPEMRALRGVHVAFLPMSLPYTMPPDEVAACAKAIRPEVLFPYHDRGSDAGELARLLEGSGIEVRVRDWYAHAAAPGVQR